MSERIRTRCESFIDARQTLNESRYVIGDENSVEEIFELSNLMLEVAFHLDRLNVYDPEMLEQWRHAAGATLNVGSITQEPTSAALVLGCTMDLVTDAPDPVDELEAIYRLTL